MLCLTHLRLFGGRWQTSLNLIGREYQRRDQLRQVIKDTGQEALYPALRRKASRPFGASPVVGQVRQSSRAVAPQKPLLPPQLLPPPPPLRSRVGVQEEGGGQAAVRVPGAVEAKRSGVAGAAAEAIGVANTDLCHRLPCLHVWFSRRGSSLNYQI